MNVVIVESPAKAKTITNYLGGGYTVLASYGHIRDLPSKDGSVRPESGFAMDWEIDPKAHRHIRQIAAAVGGAERLFLATDPDREGEAIAWHVCEVLAKKNLLANVAVKRVVFNEITKSAIVAAFAHPRDLDRELIDAYLARRALDYLFGFTLSPVLWRKLPGSRSAGRVQSVALRLICDRETEIEKFGPREYWSIKGDFQTAAGEKVSAQLTHLNGDKLDKMAIATAEAAADAVRAVEAGAFTAARVEKKQTRRHPAAPFTTSTLQMEAARKLRFSTKRTMQIAQKLYEGVSIGSDSGGLITYMRTDGVQMAGEAVSACRQLIGSRFGDNYLPTKPRFYKTKAKNAQEAHEAIRPTGFHRLPEDVARHLDADHNKLYQLIWKRAVASQMESAVLDQVSVDLATSDNSTVLRATGSVIAFDGFFKLYQESRSDADKGEKETILPDIRQGQPLELVGAGAEQHFTQPPPRYSEASLVKGLEELGIGRPSTYASIISVLQDRDYVRLDKRRFIPEDRGRLVTAFLASFFTRYVEYNFTAEMEQRLDDISGGRIQWKTVLGDFWEAFKNAVGETEGLRVRQVLDALNDLLAPHFFPDTGGGDARACPACNDGRLSLKVGKFGAFIGCSNYPQCRHTRPLTAANGNGPEGAADNGPRELGEDPASGLLVSLRSGPYGAYVQLGVGTGSGKEKVKPKRASLPRGLDAAGVDLEKALGLLALPREIGVYPDSGETIAAGIGRYGPYLRHGGVYLSLKGDDDVLSIGLNRAVELIASAPKKEPPKTLGKHPQDGKPVTLRKGRWGPYVQHGSVRANLGKGVSEEAVTLEEALKLLAAKGGKKKPAARKKKAAKKKKN